MSSNYVAKVVRGTMWTSIDRFGTMGFQFVINIVLARLLCPEDFGTVGLLYIFINVSQVLVDSGFASALIQKKKPTQTEYSTIFYWNLCISVVLYVILFLLAPYIAEFYSIPILDNILKVLGFGLIINALLTIQQNRLTKQLELKKLAIIHLSSYALSASLSISLAIYGFGVWSIVAYQLSQALFITIFLWITTKWLPSLLFSFEAFKELFRFGGYLLASNILQTVGQNFQGLIIGRKFSATQMGYFSQAQKLGTISCNALPTILVTVMYPVYSSMQDDLHRLSNTLKLNLKVVSYIVFPILAFLIIVSTPLIRLLFGNDWLPVVPYFRILCVGGIFTCIHNLLYYAIAAVGKSRELFVCGVIKWTVFIALLLIGMNFGMIGLIWSMAIGEFTNFIINALLVSRYCQLSLSSQIKIVFGFISLVVIAGIPSFCMDYYIGLHPFIIGLIFAFTYITISYLLKLPVLVEAKSIFIKVFKRKS